LLIYPVSEIKNPDKPLKGNWGFDPKMIWKIEGAGNNTFGSIDQILVDGKDTLYINDNSKINYIIDQNGKFIKKFGEKGEGPGEIIEQRISSLLEDMIVISDRSKLHYFKLDGTFIKSLNNDYFLRTPVIFLNENEFISAPYSTSHFPDGKGSVSKINLKSREKRDLAGFSLFQGGMVSAVGAQIVWIVNELAPLMIIGYHDNKLYYGMSDIYKINVSDLEGKILYTFSLERERKEISDQTKRDLFPSAGSGVPKEIVKILLKNYSNKLTYFTHIEIHNNFIYVFLSDVENKYRKEIDIFSLDGKYQYRARIEFDKRFTIPSPTYGNNIFITNDYLYVLLADEGDALWIFKYKIKIPG
jgi:hypothetical protein